MHTYIIYDDSSLSNGFISVAGLFSDIHKALSNVQTEGACK